MRRPSGPIGLPEAGELEAGRKLAPRWVQGQERGGCSVTGALEGYLSRPIPKTRVVKPSTTIGPFLLLAAFWTIAILYGRRPQAEEPLMLPKDPPSA
jgi:hypothetical protein